MTKMKHAMRLNCVFTWPMGNTKASANEDQMSNYIALER